MRQLSFLRSFDKLVVIAVAFSEQIVVIVFRHLTSYSENTDTKTDNWQKKRILSGDIVKVCYFVVVQRMNRKVV